MSENFMAITSGHCPTCSWLDHPDGPEYKFHPDGICRALPAMATVDWNGFGCFGREEDEHHAGPFSRPVSVGEVVLCVCEWDEQGEYDGAMVSWGVVTEVFPSGHAIVKHRSETGRNNGIAYSRHV